MQKECYTGTHAAFKYVVRLLVSLACTRMARFRIPAPGTVRCDRNSLRLDERSIDIGVCIALSADHQHLAVGIEP